MAELQEVPLDNIDLISEPRLYEVAEYFGVTTYEGRMENKKSLIEILNWGRKAAQSENIRDILLSIKQAERTLVRDGLEPRIGHFRKFVRVESMEEDLKKEKELLLKPPEVKEPLEKGIKEAT